MFQLYIIARNTFKESLRKKILLSLGVSCFFILSISLLLGHLSLDERVRLMMNFGLAAVQISLVILSVFLGTSIISGDLEKKTLLIVLTRPLRPSLYFLGRYLGVSLILLMSLVVLALLLTLFLVYLQAPLSIPIIPVFFGMYLESLFLLAFVVFFASYSNSFLVLIYSFSLFIVGHFVDSLKYLLGEGDSLLSKILYCIPNLERVNWKSIVVYGDTLPLRDFFSSSIYIWCWIVLMLSLAFVHLEKRDFL
ncbi:MAG: hypothetical protein ACR2M7_00455 [Bdellovibrionales bacterium]